MRIGKHGARALTCTTVVMTLVLASCASTPSSSAAFDRARSAAARAAGGTGAVTPAATERPSPSSVRPAPSGGPPSWITRYPNDPRYFIGIGGSADTGNPSQDMAAAQKNARNALASEIATTISSQTSLDTRANAAGDTKRSVAVLINEQVNLTLNGVQLVDSYHSKKLGYWYYYRLSRRALDPHPAIEGGVAELLKAVQPPLNLSLGSITYSNTGLSSGMSMYLQDQILLALRGKKGVHISATPAGAGARARASGSEPAATRGLSVTAAAGKKGAAEGTSSTGSAPSRYDLTGSFFGKEGGQVTVFLRLTDPTQKSVVASSSFTLSSAMLPAALSVVPHNYATAVAARHAVASVGASSGSGLEVHLSPTRGDGATYFDGEDLVLNVSANRNCYIKLYHIDVHGRVSLILPNRFSQDDFIRAGTVYRIPSTGSSYRFKLGKPFGVEFIKLVASTRPFANIEQAFTDLGPATRGLLTRGLTVTGTGPEETAQAMVSYTILAKGG